MLDYGTVFEILSSFFKREKLDYCIIGATALFAHGYKRNTEDLDFITELKYQGKIIGFMESIGFITENKTSAFSNHRLAEMQIDFMYIADAKTSHAILKNSDTKTIFNQTRVPVVSVENLVALKLFSAQNNPDRKLKDLSDIKEVLKINAYDKTYMHALFKKFDLEAYFEECTKK
ncbi:MAG: nucleotidyltransferase [Chitinivibrionales bacterium]|nr:nucleotidyltransferase [Chitinivibrionales bacterium]